MDVETDPEQPPAITDAIVELMASAPDTADPWWRAGVDESLET